MERRVKSWLTVAAVIAALGAAAARHWQLGDRLLRADPDAVPRDARLWEFGVARGRTLFHGHCDGCHGMTGRGNAVLGVPNLTDDDWLYGSGRVSDIETVVAHGIRAPASKTWNLAVMPAYARAQPSSDVRLQPLSPLELQDVIDYLLAIEHRPHDAAAALRGAAVFTGRGACYDCHATDGGGDPAIGAPNLTDAIWLYGDGSRAAIQDTLEKGRRGTCPAWAGRLNTQAIREIALYVYSLSHHGG